MKNTFIKVVLTGLVMLFSQLSVAQISQIIDESTSLSSSSTAATNINIVAHCSNCESVSTSKIVVSEGVNPDIYFEVTMNYSGGAGYLTIYEKDAFDDVFDIRLGNDQYVGLNGGFHYTTLNDGSFNDFEGSVYVKFESTSGIKSPSNTYTIEIEKEEGTTPTTPTPPTSTPPTSTPPTPTTPDGFSEMHSYWMERIDEQGFLEFQIDHEGLNHYYTTDYSEYEGGEDIGRTRFNYEGFEFYISDSQIIGTVPFYRYYNREDINHFYTSNFDELGSEYHFDATIGYIFLLPGEGRVPLYRYYNDIIVDHYYTPDFSKLGNGASGWAYEGIAGYVVTPESSEAYEAAQAPYLIKTATVQPTTDDNYEFELGDYNGDGVPDLYAIKRKNSANNFTELSVMDGADNYKSYLLKIATVQPTTDDNYEFEVGDYNKDGIPDLYAIKKQNSVNDFTQLFVMDGADNYQSYLLKTATVQSTTDDNYEFELGDYNKDGIPDLYAIKKQNSVNDFTQLFVMDGADRYASYLIRTTTVQPTTDDNYEFELGDYNYDGVPDLYAVKRMNRANNFTELFIMDGANNYGSYLQKMATVQSTTDDNYEFELGDFNNDGAPDLYAIKKKNSVNNFTQLFILNGLGF